MAFLRVIYAFVCVLVGIHGVSTQTDRQINQTSPNYGPVAGGTNLTMIGGNFSGLMTIELLTDNLDPVDCMVYRTSDVIIQCETQAVNTTYIGLDLAIRLYFDTDDNDTLDSPDVFTYRPDPIIDEIPYETKLETIERGGIKQVIRGKNLDSIFRPRMTMTLVETHGVYNNITVHTPQPYSKTDVDEYGIRILFCTVENSTLMYCLTPPFTDHNLELPANDPEQGYNHDGFRFWAGFVLDGVQEYENHTQIYVFADPEIDDFPGQNKVKAFKVYDGEQLIEIDGNYFNYATDKSDYNITIGEDGVCEITELLTNLIQCRPPQTKPTVGDNNYKGEPSVFITVGFLTDIPGYLDYQDSLMDDPQVVSAIIASCCIAGLLIIFIPLAVVFYNKKKRRDEERREMLDRETRYRRPPGLIDRVPPDVKVRLEPCMKDAQRLQIGKVLGEGNFGSVHAGKFLGDDDRTVLVAAKTLKETGVSKEEFREFLEEATLMKDFHHDNVLHLVGVVFKEGRPWVLLPYMENGDLRSFLLNSSNCFTVANLIDYGKQAAMGMAYLEECRCVHRDLAARNCMVSKENVLKIADFGLARDIFQGDYYRVGNMTRPLPVKWMAPECLDDHKFTSKSDVWSYGVLLWEVLTRGKRPYSQVGNYDLKPFLLTGRRLEQPEHAPPQIYELMLQCWDLNPDDRPTFKEVDECLVRILQEEEDEAVATHTEPRSRTTAVDLYQNLSRYVDVNTDRPHGYERLSTDPRTHEDAPMGIDYKAGAAEFDDIADPSRDSAHASYLTPAVPGAEGGTHNSGYLSPESELAGRPGDKNSYLSPIATGALPSNGLAAAADYPSSVVIATARNPNDGQPPNSARYMNMAKLSDKQSPETKVQNGFADHTQVVLQTKE